MIKALVKDLTYDSITLNQALTRAKLVAYEIGNEDFKFWISKELNGYTHEDTLPEYRVIPCDTYATLRMPFGETRTVPFDLTNLDNDLNGKIYKMNMLQSISTLEKSLEMAEGTHGFEELPMGLVNILREMSGEDNILKVKRRVQFSQLAHIISLTKQKLIDTLLELSSAFPNLDDSYNRTAENNEIAKTIINNHIYGDNSSSNIGVGGSISQTVSNSNKQKTSKIISELAELGVPQEDLKDVQEIIAKEQNTSGFGKSLMNWAGKLASKTIEKGIDLHLPMIFAKVQELL